MTDENKKHFDWQLDKNPIIFTRTGADALKDLAQQEIQNPAINFHDTADVKTVYEIMAEPHPIDIKPWQITTVDAIEEPTTEKELSKIWEELANLNQTNNELRKERKADKKENKEQQLEIEQLKKENQKLKTKLKKEKTKSKSNNNQMQSEIDDLQNRMNEAEDVLHIKKDGI